MRKKWTDEENELIRIHYPDKRTVDILHLFENVTVGKLQQHAASIGVKKSEAFMKSPESGRLLKGSKIGLKTQFTNQSPGWNKGKKQADYMTPEMIEKTAKTRFKKGQDPHNTVPIGTERISKDGYIEVKVRHLKGKGSNNANFEFKHRIIYEENFGPIPEGMIVEFLDGDKLNFEPSNFILRSRKENLLRNTVCDTSIVKRFLGVKEPELVEKIIQEMPEFIELKRKTIVLNQKINESKRKTNSVVNG